MRSCAAGQLLFYANMAMRSRHERLGQGIANQANGDTGPVKCYPADLLGRCSQFQYVFQLVVVMAKLKFALVPLHKPKWKLNGCPSVFCTEKCLALGRGLGGAANIFDAKNIVCAVFTQKVDIPDKIWPFSFFKDCSCGEREFCKFAGVFSKPVRARYNSSL